MGPFGQDTRDQSFELDQELRPVGSEDELGAAQTPNDSTNEWYALCGDDQPCPRCPVERMRDADGLKSETACHMKEGLLRFCKVSHLEDGNVQVRIFEMSSDDFGAAQSARIDALAAQSKLSARECEVLEQLLLGGSTKEVAAALNISPRTVKFHQRNLLTKLGADSRTDLLRVLR